MGKVGLTNFGVTVMKYINTNDQAGNQHWELRDESGQPVEVGRIVTTARDDDRNRRFELRGGTPPHKPSSTGKVYGHWLTLDEGRNSGDEYYPQVFNLKWFDLQAAPTAEEPAEEPAAPSSPSGQLIGVVIQSMVNDAVKAQLAQNMEAIVAATIESFESTLSNYVRKDDFEMAMDTLDEESNEYLIADEHDYVESTDLADAINQEIDNRSFISEGDQLDWDVDDHASSIQDLMQTSLQSEVQSIVHDMVRNRALIVSLNPE